VNDDDNEEEANLFVLPWSEKDSVFSQRDDEGGGAFKSGGDDDADAADDEKRNQPTQYRTDFIRSFKLTPLRRQPRGPANLTDRRAQHLQSSFFTFNAASPFPLFVSHLRGRTDRRSSKQLLPR
jgi:hypothetical protein